MWCQKLAIKPKETCKYYCKHSNNFAAHCTSVCLLLRLVLLLPSNFWVELGCIEHDSFSFYNCTVGQIKNETPLFIPI